MSLESTAAHESNEYEQVFNTNERYVELLLGSAETLCAFDSCQVDDYSKVVIESFDPVHKAKRRTEVLPLEWQRAFELGLRLAGADSVVRLRAIADYLSAGHPFS